MYSTRRDQLATTRGTPSLMAPAISANVKSFFRSSIAKTSSFGSLRTAGVGTTLSGTKPGRRLRGKTSLEGRCELSPSNERSFNWDWH
jgi:hypothetical protein